MGLSPCFEHRSHAGDRFAHAFEPFGALEQAGGIGGFLRKQVELSGLDEPVSEQFLRGAFGDHRLGYVDRVKESLPHVSRTLWGGLFGGGRRCQYHQDNHHCQPSREE